MNVVRELLTVWGFEIDDKKLDKAEEKLEGIKQRLDFMIGLEVAKGLFELGEKFSHVAEEIELAATSAGLTVEEFQKLSFAANQANVSQEELGHSLALLSRRLYEARNGGQQAIEAFQRVGIPGERVRSFKTSEEALFALSDRFAKISDPIQRAAAAQELMGRGSARMVGFLSKGSAAIRGQADEAAKLGAVLGEKQIQALVHLEEALKKVFAILKAVAGTIAADVAPLINYMVEDFIKFFNVNRKIIETNFHVWLTGLAFALGFVWAAIKYGTELFLEFAKALHIQDHILQIIAGFASMIAGLLIVAKGISVVSHLFNTFTGVLDKLKKTWQILSAVEWGALLPYIAIAAAIGILILVIQNLWAHLNGEASWLDNFWDWLQSLDLIQEALEWISKTWATVKDSFGKAFDFISSKLPSFGDNTFGQNIQNITTPALATGTQNSSISNNNVSVSAPITMNIAGSADPEALHRSVKDGIREHLDRTSRETRASTTNPVKY